MRSSKIENSDLSEVQLQPTPRLMFQAGDDGHDVTPPPIALVQLHRRANSDPPNSNHPQLIRDLRSVASTSQITMSKKQSLQHQALRPINLSYLMDDVPGMDGRDFTPPLSAKEDSNRRDESDAKHVPEHDGGMNETTQLFRQQIGQQIKLSETVLSKRTEMRYEQTKLETSRQFFWESAGAFMAATEAQRDKRAERRWEKRKETIKFEDISNQSGELDGSPVKETLAAGQSTSDQNPMLDNSLDSTMGLQEDAVGPETPRSPDSNALYQQLRKDFETVTRQEEAWKKLEDELSNLDNALRERQKTWKQAISAPNFAFSLRSELLEHPIESWEGAEVLETDAASMTPTLVAEFFDRKGDISIYDERLKELDYDHQEGLAQREMVEDRGDTLEVTEAEFVDNYRSRRNIIEQDLVEAMAEAKNLMEACFAAGFDPNSYQNVRPPTSRFGPFNPGLPNQSTRVPIIHTDTVAMQPPKGTEHIPSSTRISDWLRRIENNQPVESHVPDEDELPRPVHEVVDSRLPTPTLVERWGPPAGEVAGNSPSKLSPLSHNYGNESLTPRHPTPRDPG